MSVNQWRQKNVISAVQFRIPVTFARDHTHKYAPIVVSARCPPFELKSFRCHKLLISIVPSVWAHIIRVDYKPTTPNNHQENPSMGDIHRYLLVIMLSVYRDLVAVLLFSDGANINGVPPEGRYANRECVLGLQIIISTVDCNIRLLTCAPLNSIVALTG